jgi:putative sporulation protein YyaC
MWLNKINLRRGLILMWPFKMVKNSVLKVERPNIISIKETTEDQEIEKIANKLKEVINQASKEVIFLCIGSDRSTGDSLGPIVGTKLKEKGLLFPVYGTLEEPVHALNLKKVLKEINFKHENPFILGIDACLGDEKQIGMIILKEGSLIPGNALNKELPSVGDYHMKAIVNYFDPISPMQSLNYTRLFTVIKLSEIITKIITRAATLDVQSFK